MQAAARIQGHLPRREERRAVTLVTQRPGDRAPRGRRGQAHPAAPWWLPPRNKAPPRAVAGCLAFPSLPLPFPPLSSPRTRAGRPGLPPSPPRRQVAASAPRKPRAGFPPLRSTGGAATGLSPREARAARRSRPEGPRALRVRGVYVCARGLFWGANTQRPPGRRWAAPSGPCAGRAPGPPVASAAPRMPPTRDGNPPGPTRPSPGATGANASSGFTSDSTRRSHTRVRQRPQRRLDEQRALGCRAVLPPPPPVSSRRRGAAAPRYRTVPQAPATQFLPAAALRFPRLLAGTSVCPLPAGLEVSARPQSLGGQSRGRLALWAPLFVWGLQLAPPHPSAVRSGINPHRVLNKRTLRALRAWWLLRVVCPCVHCKPRKEGGKLEIVRISLVFEMRVICCFCASTIVGAGEVPP